MTFTKWIITWPWLSADHLASKQEEKARKRGTQSQEVKDLKWKSRILKKANETERSHHERTNYQV